MLQALEYDMSPVFISLSLGKKAFIMPGIIALVLFRLVSIVPRAIYHDNNAGGVYDAKWVFVWRNRYGFRKELLGVISSRLKLT